MAVGDVHGDLDALRGALRAAHLIDASNRWSGGRAVLVQTGDVLDRGDQEQEIVDWLDGLGDQAREAGGDVLELLGNHEVMNVAGDLRYVTPGGFEDFEDVKGLDLSDPKLARAPQGARARLAAFLPGGRYALEVSEHPTIGMVGATVFVHGGVLPHHVSYGVERLNGEVSEWMRGDRAELPPIMSNEQAPLWTRVFSTDPVSPENCALLGRVLDSMGAARMVVGHTPQPSGITSACDERVWRIDVGMARHYGGAPAALEIRGDQVSIIAVENGGE